MSSAKQALPKVASQEERLAARNGLLVKEKAITHAAVTGSAQSVGACRGRESRSSRCSLVRAEM